MTERLSNQISNLQDAVENFLAALSLNPEDYDTIAADSIKSGQIQKFEFCIEAYWKTLKRYILDYHGEDLKSPKSVLKKALDLKILHYSSYEELIQMLNWRNELSHTYQQARFEEIRKAVISTRNEWPAYLEVFQQYGVGG